MAKEILKISHTPEPDPDDPMARPSLDPGICWNDFQNLPNSPDIFVARDHAARYLLTQICGPLGEDSLPHLVRTELEKAMGLRDWARCQKILAVDRPLALLSTERTQWKELLRQLMDAESKAGEKDLYLAQSGYKFVLLTTDNPTVCELAIRRIKEIQAAHVAAHP